MRRPDAVTDEVFSCMVDFAGIQHSVEFETELAGITGNGTRRLRYFCRTCQEQSGLRTHPFATGEFSDGTYLPPEARAEFEAAIAQIQEHARWHELIGGWAFTLGRQSVRQVMEEIDKPAANV